MLRSAFNLVHVLATSGMVQAVPPDILPDTLHPYIVYGCAHGPSCFFGCLATSLGDCGAFLFRALKVLRGLGALSSRHDGYNTLGAVLSKGRAVDTVLFAGLPVSAAELTQYMHHGAQCNQCLCARARPSRAQT